MQAETARVAVLDVGSVKSGHIGWAAIDVDFGVWTASPARHVANAGTELAGLTATVDDAFGQGMPVALGFECPLFVPVPRDKWAINSPRCGEPRDRSYAVGAGATSLVTGLAEVSWGLRGMRRRSSTVDPDRWPRPCEVLIWEAFVSKNGKGGSDAQSLPDGWPTHDLGEHPRDAAAAAMAFIRKRRLGETSDIGACGHPFLNTAVAAALRFDVPIDTDELARPCYTARALD